MAGSTTSTLDDLLPQIVAEAMFVASERSIMRGLVKNYQLANGQGKTVRVPIFPLQTATTLTEGDEVTNTAVSTDGVQLTVTTAAIRTLVTDLAVASSASNVVADLGRLFGEAVARKIDQDAMALFKGFTTQSGAWDAALSAATVANAVAKLRANAVPADALACVVHPLVAYDLKANMTNTFANPNAGIIQNEAMTMGYVGTLFGVPVFESSNTEEVDGSPGDYYGAVFHRDAIGIAMIGDIGIETQRRASYLGTDVVGFCHYGVGEIYDGYGVKIAADSSIKP